MGSTPGAYPLTSEQLKAMDANGADPLTSEELRTGYGLAATYTSANLLGLTDYVPMSTPTLNVSTVTLKAADNGAVAHGTNVTCSQPTGGTGSYTYTWEKVSGQTLSVSQSKTAYFSRSATGQITTSVYRCKVTDGVGTVYSGNVTINFYHYQLKPESMVAGTVYTSFAEAGTGQAIMYIQIQRDGTWRAWDAHDSIVRGSGDWVAPKSSTVGDDFDVYLNDDDTGVGGANSNVTAYNCTLNTATQLNAVRGASRANTVNGSIYVAGVRIRIRGRDGGLGYQFDVQSIGLRASVGTASMGGPLL